ncbi:MAG: nitroreductase family protein [Lachnospirales bacterium]
MNEIYKRRSIRKFANKKVEKDKIDKLLRAAMQAPSAVNQQSWEFLVIENKETLAKISEMGPFSSMVRDSGVTFLLMGNMSSLRFEELWQQDLSAATQNLLLEVVTQELGAVWVGVQPVEARVKHLRDMFNLPEHIKPFALVAVGYPQEEENKFVDRYNGEKVHFEKY